VTATLTTLVDFPYPANVPGASLSDLIADSNGDLFGAAPLGPSNSNVLVNGGLVYEIAKTATGRGRGQSAASRGPWWARAFCMTRNRPWPLAPPPSLSGRDGVGGRADL
jgi:hypothetical protein